MSHLQNFYTPKCEAIISDARITLDGLMVDFIDDTESHLFSWFWVRDHGIDANSLDQLTTQRKTDTFSIPHDISCEKLELDRQAQIIHLHWDDGSQTQISNYMLASVIDRAQSLHQLAPGKKRVIWDKNNPLNEIPCVDYEAVVNTDDGLRELLENIHIYGFSLAENVPATEAATELFAKRVGRVQETIFDVFWPLSSELTDHGDTAYTNSYLEPHTDATYYHDAPGLQMFNCLRFDGKGGESIQVDGFAVAERVKQEDPQAYQTLCEISVPGHYIEPGVHLRAERPCLRLDQKGDLVQVSFNNYDRAPFMLPDADAEQFYYAYSLFHKHALDQENWLKIPLRPGNTLIFDNWRNMHGRMGYVGKREFYGCYHSRAEYESKLRTLQTAAAA
ncbi:MAG: trimethyllysine dioxygenase [Pseudomonadota bacterium]